MKIVLHILDWGDRWLREMLDKELWEATVEKFGDEAEEIFNTHEVTVEIDGDYFIVSIGQDFCRCCGKGSEDLTPCPQCGEPLCQNCLPPFGAHICEPE